MQYIEPALERARKFFEKRYPRRSEARARRMARLTADVAGDGVPEADVVIEAIFENLEREARAVRAPRAAA